MAYQQYLQNNSKTVRKLLLSQNPQRILHQTIVSFQSQSSNTNILDVLKGSQSEHELKNPLFYPKLDASQSIKVLSKLITKHKSTPLSNGIFPNSQRKGVSILCQNILQEGKQIPNEEIIRVFSCFRCLKIPQSTAFFEGEKWARYISDRVGNLDGIELAEAAVIMSSTDFQNKTYLMNKVGVSVAQYVKNLDQKYLTLIAHSFAVNQTPCPSLFHAIAHTSSSKLNELQSYEISLLVWAFARVGAWEESFFNKLLNGLLMKKPLFSPNSFPVFISALATLNVDLSHVHSSVLVEKALEYLPKMTPNKLKMTMHGFSTLGVRSPKLRSAAELRFIESIDLLSPSGLADVASSFASSNSKHELLFDEITAHALRKVDKFCAKSASKLAFAYARHNIRPLELLKELPSSVIKHRNSLCPTDINRLASAYAQLGCFSSKLLHVLAHVSLEKVQAFDAMHCRSVAEVFALFRSEMVPPIELFDVLASRAIEKIDDFKPRDLCVLARSFAQVNIYSPPLFNVIDDAVVSNVKSYALPGLTELVWSFSTLGHDAPQLFDAVVRSLCNNAKNSSPKSLTRLAWAFANKGVVSTQLFSVIDSEVSSKIKHFSILELSVIISSFSVVDAECTKILAANESRLRDLNSSSPKELSHLAVAYTQALPRNSHNVLSMLRNIISQSAEGIKECSNWDLSVIAWAVGKLGDRDFGFQVLESVNRECFLRINEFNETDHLSMILASHANLCHRDMGLINAIVQRYMRIKDSTEFESDFNEVRIHHEIQNSLKQLRLDNFFPEVFESSHQTKITKSKGNEGSVFLDYSDLSSYG